MIWFPGLETGPPAAGFGAETSEIALGELARLEVECYGKVSLLSVSGDLDFSNSPALDAAIAAVSQAHRGLVVISFADCQFADASCLRVLIRQFKLLPARLLIVAPPGSWLRRLLDLTSLSATLPVYNGLREAQLPMASGNRGPRDALATCNS